MTAVPLRYLAECDFKDGKVDDGLAKMERAVVACQRSGCTTGSYEDSIYYLGHKLIETGRDRKRGLALLRTARAGLAKLGRDDDVKELDRELAKYRR